MVFFGDTTSQNIETSEQLTVLSFTHREQRHLVAPAVQNTHEKVLERHVETQKRSKSSSGTICVMAAATAGLMKLCTTAAILKTHLLPAK